MNKEDIMRRFREFKHCTIVGMLSRKVTEKIVGGKYIDCNEEDRMKYGDVLVDTNLDNCKLMCNGFMGSNGLGRISCYREKMRIFI